LRSEAKDPLLPVFMIPPGKGVDPRPSLALGPLEAKKITAKRKDSISIPVAAINRRFQDERPGLSFE
jgi:hypothetical protein